MANKIIPIPDGYYTVTPHLVINGAAKAIEFYKSAFDAKEEMRHSDPSGKIGHAEIRIGNSKIMLSDEFPEMNCKGPKSFGGSPVSIYLYVNDVDSTAKQAVKAGAKEIRPVTNQFYGDRIGTFEDPFGHIWHIASHVEDVSAEEIERRAKVAHSGK